MGHILYIDESYSKDHRYIVVSSLVVPMENWRSIDQNIHALKKKFFSSPDINLKMIRKRDHEDRKYWDNLTSEQKDDFNEKLYEILRSNGNVVITALIDTHKMEEKKKDTLFYLSYGFIIQRYQYLLSENNSFGFVIMDSADTSPEIRKLFLSHRQFLSDGVPIKRSDFTLKGNGEEFTFKDYERLTLGNVCENLFFLDDKCSNLLQSVDLIAAAFHSKYNRGIEKWFDLIKPIIRKSSEGKIEGYGLKIFPTPEKIHQEEYDDPYEDIIKDIIGIP